MSSKDDRDDTNGKDLASTATADTAGMHIGVELEQINERYIAGLASPGDSQVHAGDHLHWQG